MSVGAHPVGNAAEFTVISFLFATASVVINSRYILLPITCSTECLISKIEEVDENLVQCGNDDNGSVENVEKNSTKTYNKVTSVNNTYCVKVLWLISYPLYSQLINKYKKTQSYEIMYNRYVTFFSPEIAKSLIEGILCYAWLISSEINLPMSSDEFQTIVITKHNLIVSSIENNTANDNLYKKIANGIINPPEVVAFMSRQQLLPEFHGKRAQMILTRAEAEDAEIIDPEKMEDGFYECKKCGKRKTKHYEMQTRSADEPMTIFVICYLCHITWKAL